MKQNIFRVTLLVREYDEAIEFYTQKLQFILVEDNVMSETKRWVVVAPSGSVGCNLLLAKASTEEQESRIGNQTGGRVFLFLHTDDFNNYFQHLLENEVKIVREPSIEPYGKVAVFADLYGNMWDLIELAEK